MKEPYPVLIFACVYPPENIVGAHRPARFAKYLPRFGYQPYIVTASAQPADAPPYVLHAPFHFGPLELALHWTFFPYDDRLSWVSVATRAAEKVAAGQRPSLVFSTSPPVATHLAAARLQKRFGMRWVADFRDPLVGNFDRRSRLGRIADRIIERRVARQADGIILNTEAAAEKFRARYPEHRGKVRFIYNGFDPEEGLGPRPVPARPHKVWIHSGSVYINRYPFRLFDALDRLVSSGSLRTPFLVRLIGTIQDDSLLARPSFRRLQEAGHISCTATNIARPEAQRETAEADGGIVFDHYHAAGANLAIPMKLYDYICVGRPILAFTSRGAQLHTVLAGSGISNVCIFEEDPPAEIERKLLEFAQLPTEPRAPSEWFRLRFSAIEQTRQLAALFDELRGEN